MNIREKISQLQNHLNAKNFKFVIEECNKLIKKNPYNSYFYNLCGLALQGSNNIIASIEYFKKSIDLDKNNIAAKNNISTSYKAIGKYDLSENYLKDALKISPNYIQALNNYANLNTNINNYKSAIQLLEKAKKIEPNNVIILYNLADTYKAMGNFSKSKEIFEFIIDKFDFHTPSHLSLSSIYKYDTDSLHLKEMLSKLKSNNITTQNRIDLSFAIGKAYEDIGDFKKSFYYYEQGNKLNKEKINYKIKNDEKLINSIIDSFKDYNFDKQLKNSNKINPIFVCGMPRSGTTLVEQIISSHDEVSGEGELSYLQNLVIQNFIENNSFKIKKIKDLVDSNNTKITDEYFNMVKFHKLLKNNFTDKAPQNFRWLGVIRIFFPNSKVILCSRNSKDICLSLFKNYFPASEMNWAYDQEDIGNYFNLYNKLINFWKSKFPDFIYEANYEKIINNPDVEIKKLIKFCDLHWDDKCLNFHKNKSTPIKTASVVQARNPLYKNSINLNENYSVYLKKLFSIIN